MRFNFKKKCPRCQTKMAGELAGLNVLRIIAEPTSALLSSNIDMKKGGKFMVVDTCINAKFFQIFAVTAKLIRFVNFSVFMRL